MNVLAENRSVVSMWQAHREALAHALPIDLSLRDSLSPYNALCALQLIKELSRIRRIVLVNNDVCLRSVILRADGEFKVAP